MKLIVFDCDGTLADSQHAIVRAMADAFAAEGLPPPPRERVLSIVGLSLAQAMARLAPAAGGALVRRLADRYREVASAAPRRPDHGEPLFPGARETIARLAARGDAVLGVATGKSLSGLDRLLDREGLRPFFATLQTSDTHPSKPHPAMLLEAMAEAGADPALTVMIGDSTYDVEMARSAGAAMIGVAWGYHPPSALLAAGAGTIAQDFEALEREIDRLLPPIAKAS